MISKYKKKKIEESKRKAYTLYLDGWTTRDIGNVLGYSHSWVSYAIKELEAKITGNVEISTD